MLAGSISYSVNNISETRNHYHLHHHHHQIESHNNNENNKTINNRINLYKKNQLHSLYASKSTAQLIEPEKILSANRLNKLNKDLVIYNNEQKFGNNSYSAAFAAGNNHNIYNRANSMYCGIQSYSKTNIRNNQLTTMPYQPKEKLKNQEFRIPQMSKGSKRLMGLSTDSKPTFSSNSYNSNNKLHNSDDDDEEYVMMYDANAESSQKPLESTEKNLENEFTPSASSTTSASTSQSSTDPTDSFKKSASSTDSNTELNSKKNSTLNNYQEMNDAFGEKDRVRVIVRIRPLNEKEKNNSNNEIISCDRHSLVVDAKTQGRKFQFNTVFDPNSIQEEMFNYSGVKRLINMAIDGYICTCFAYGQTGSGKTYTMVGPAGIYNLNSQDKFMHYGLIPRSINYLFNQLRLRTQESASVFYIRVSYFEIYNEQIRDLINPTSARKLEIRGSQEEGFFVDNLFATYIETMDEILTILQEGELNRVTASHLLNEHSSRSHAILTIQVENEMSSPTSQDPNEQITKLGKLIFVDLAGSEKVKITQSKGKNLVETNNINKSLLVLGTCISALSEQSKHKNNMAGHIPYRDSKLTKLLSESLGGAGITLMIACVSPSSVNEQETLNTLRYANRAQNIENIPIMKSDSRENVVQKLKRELRKLKEENLTLKQKLSYPNASSGRLPKIPANTHRNGSSNSSASSEADLYGMLQEYIQENKNLKTENSQLEKFREKVRKQHEILTRENEKLARKLEQVLRSQGNSSNIIQKQQTEFAIDEQIKTLPKIEKQSSVNNNGVVLNPVDQQSYTNGTSSPRKNSPSKNGFSNSNSSFDNNGGEVETIEQIPINKPTYTRKFKQIKDYKTKFTSDQPTNKTNSKQSNEDKSITSNGAQNGKSRGYNKQNGSNY